MKTKFLFIGTIVILTTICCKKTGNSSSFQMSDEDLANYKEIMAAAQGIEQSLDDISFMTAEEILNLNEISKDLYFDYDPMGMDSSSQAACEQLKQRIKKLKLQLDSAITASVPNVHVDIAKNHDKLIEQTATLPVYLQRGDSLFVNIKAERAFTLSILNSDAKSTLITRKGKTTYNEKIAIKNSAIYLIDINPGTKAQYADWDIYYKVKTIDHLQKVRVSEEEVPAEKNEWRARSIKGIKMQSLFEEPRKFTLRGQLKAAFSGSYRALVAVQVPAGATDILYSLRISTNERNRSEDGNFYDNMETSYKQIKLLGLPIYESHKGSGLIATLLGENQPVREEDAYINMYVFYNAAQAKKFQDGIAASSLSYNVDYSTLGTQSCNGRIPSKGYKIIYLAFENERMRYNNYIWLEAISAVPKTEYFKTKYSIK
ncbi:MAG: hypothetical protein MJZ22_03125 [Candidatus Saccharibacteria bacterium]|nr:hypothetical protein [Candidatus Saccharibacteria bacterium]